MVEPGPSTSQNQFDEQSNVVMYPEDVDSLSTNQCNEQLDEESERTNEEERTSTPTSEMGLELNEELEAGYKILMDLMSHSKRAANWPFMEAVEVSAPELAIAYNNKIEKPVWLKMMKQKFEEHQYTTITAFVTDFRLMLENCYRFNGPDHYISKRAQKMETMLEQKLALLPRDIRDKTTIAATTEKKSDGNSGFRRRPKSHILHDSTYLLNQLREAEYQKKREYRIRQIMARRAEREALAQEIMEWEENVLFGGKKHQMKAMWEIPQIGLFLFLCQGPLNIGEIMHFELERCFMMPRESSTMQLIMTSLLSTPFQRLKLDRRNLMPYNVWEQKLRAKFETWYKAFSDSNNDVEKTCLKFGIDDQFFDIVGHKNPLERKRYHELSFYKKVWIMKSLCDHCLHQQDSLRETIEVQPYEDQREYLLGTDNAGQRYIHFPQFCGADVRIYRQAAVKYPKIEIKPDPFDNKRKFPFVYKPPPLKKQKLKKKKRHRPSPSKPSPSENTTPTSSPQRQRPSRLRQAPKSVVPLQLLDDTSVTEESNSSASDSEDNDVSSAAELPEPVAGGSKDLSGCVSDTDQDNEDTEFKSVDRESTGSDATLPYGDNSDSNSNLSSRDCSRNSSPYPSYSDLSVRFSSHMDQSSDISQESSPCPSPADYVRRSSRLERFSDTSRDASPLIFDADFGLRRSSRNRARLKNIPPLRATRNLSNFLVDENSVSNLSLAGENSNSLSGLGPSLFGGRLTSRKSSKSSDTNDDSYDCDIHVSKLFTNSKTSEYGADVNRTFHEVLKDTNEENPDENDSMSSVNDLPACGTIIDDESLNESEPGVSKNNTDIKNDSSKRLENHEGRLKVSSKSKAEVDERRNNTAEDKAEENLADSENLDTFKNADESVENKDSEDMEGSNKMVKENLMKMGVETEGLDTYKDNSDDADNCLEIPEELMSYSEKELVIKKELIQDHDTEEDKTDSFDANENIKIEQTENNEFETNVENLSSNDVDSGFGNSHDTKSKREIGSDVKENNSNFQIQTVKKEKNATLQNMNDENSEETSGVCCNSKEKENCDKSCSVKEENCKNNLEIKDSVDGDSNIPIKQETFESFVDAKIEPAIKEKIEGLEDSFTNKKPKNEPKEEHEKDKIELKEENETKDEYEHKQKQEMNDESDEEEEMEPDAREFEMMADCVEDIRKLAEQFAEPEPVMCRRGKKEQVQKPPRKKNIVILHERLQFLLKELEPWETKLQQATKRARLRMRKEMEDYIEEEEDDWKSNNEETESVESDSDQSDDGNDEKTTAKTTEGKMSVDSSRCSTPVKPPEDIEEIDISHRGRLRKRRIIPNNVEDQLGSKKPKPSQPQTQSGTQTEPVIVQSGKTQLVEYADIIRQLQSSGGNMPILIKTTKGGRTVLTSVMPVNAGSKGSNCVSTETLAAESVRMVSPTTVSQQIQPQAVRISAPGTMGVPATSRALQHPTIQNLLSGTVAGTRLLQKTAAASAATITTAPTSLSQDGNVTSMIQPTVVLPPTPEKAQAVKVVLANQTTPQKVVPSLVTTPRKIAPHTSASESGEKAKAKYYAANAGTLPINVVQQLISSRGAKLTQGACNQSILLIPMENDGQGKTAVSSSPSVTTVKTETSPSLTNVDEKIAKTESVTTAVKISSTPVEKIPKTESTITTAKTLPNTLHEKVAKPEVTMTTVKTSPNTPILPKPQISPVLSVSQGLPVIQIQQAYPRLSRPQAYLESYIVDGKLVTKLVQVGVMPPKSPSRYPTNETVKTLLEKRKPPMEEKEPFILEKKPNLNVVNETKHTVPKPHVNANQLNSAKKVILPVKTEENSKQLQPGNNLVQSTATVISTTGLLEDRVKTEATNAMLKAQQCVITSISAAKLNTLLLQTSAAGAKTIPSLIKLPSKAALDSAVKAVVTSVNTTLPTVNIKVPSPTSLPSIGPRRNVTKTIQTMKSPIPVAPKVVTQSSGRQTMLPVADSKTVSSQVSSVSPVQGAPSVVSLTSAKNVTGTLNTGFVTQSQTGVPDQNGKKVVTRLTPQLVLTSKGVMQLGFVNSDAVMVQKNQLTGATLAVTPTVTSASTQPGNQAMWIQNNSGQYQLIQQASPVLQQSLAGACQQQLMTTSVVTQGQGQILFAKPVVAVGPRGNPVILPPGKASIQTTSGTSPPSIVLHNSTYYATATPIKSQPHPGIITTGNDTQLAGTLANTGLKSPGATGSFQYQMGTNLVQVPQSPILTQAAMVSPVLGLQQGLVLQGGVQVASPLISPMGINLLQPGLQIAQNPAAIQGAAQTLVQKAGTVAGVPQLLTINPLLINTALTSGGVVSQQPVSIPKMSVTLKSPSTPTDNTQVAKAGSAVPKMMATWSVKYPPSSVSINSNQQMPTAQILTSSGDKGPISSTSYQQLKHQLTNLVIPAAGGAQQLSMLGQLAATPGSAQRCLNFQYPSSDSLKTARLVSPQNTVKTEPEQNICNTAIDNESVLNMPVAINQVNLGSRTSPSQQKLLLFSIGGQLVTGQGVPVSLSDGVLKVVPNGKIKVNNQILTTEQIKQTLAKINEAAAVTLNPANQQQLQNQQTTPGFNSEKVTHVKIVKDGEPANRPTAKISNQQTTSGVMQENVTHVKIVKDGGMANKSVDHTYLNTSVGKEKVVTKLLNGSSRLEGGLLKPASIKTEVDDSSANENVSPNFSGSYHVMNSDMKIEPKQEIEFLNQSEKQFVMKPMMYSSGYVFQPKTSNSGDNNIEPGKKSKNFDIGKLIVDKEAKRFFIKAPVKSDLSSGEGDASNSLHNNHNVVLKVKTETRDDDDENENKLVIDDSVSEKEAALNLLTFANQAMMPLDTMGGKSDAS